MSLTKEACHYWSTNWQLSYFQGLLDQPLSSNQQTKD